MSRLPGPRTPATDRQPLRLRPIGLWPEQRRPVATERGWRSRFDEPVPDPLREGTAHAAHVASQISAWAATAARSQIRTRPRPEPTSPAPPTPVMPGDAAAASRARHDAFPTTIT